MMLEIEFMRRILLGLGRRSDMRVWRQNTGRIQIRDEHGRVARVFNAGPPPGAADISGILIPDGLRIEIEVKSAKGRRSPAQKRWATFIESSGGIYALVGIDPKRSMPENVARAIEEIEAAILTRRKQTPP